MGSNLRRFSKKYKTHIRKHTHTHTNMVFSSIVALKTIDGLFSTPASERTYFDYCRSCGECEERVETAETQTVSEIQT